MATTPSRAHHVRSLPRFARLCALALALFSGCRSPYPVYVEHRPGDAPKAAPVPYAATYVLGAVNDADAGVAPLQHCAIQEQFQVGFIRDADGTLVAYAGGRKFPLPEGHYVWQIAPQDRKTRGEVARDNTEKALRMVLIVVGCVVAPVLYVGAGILGAGDHK